jgi:hypothetical protein
MAICVYFNPATLSQEQYDESIRKLKAAGPFPADGMLHHSCFGEGTNLMVFEVWDSQEKMDAFVQRLMPILGEVGIDPGQPMVMPVVNLVQ